MLLQGEASPLFNVCVEAISSCISHWQDASVTLSRCQPKTEWQSAVALRQPRPHGPRRAAIQGETPPQASLRLRNPPAIPVELRKKIAPWKWPRAAIGYKCSQCRGRRCPPSNAKLAALEFSHSANWKRNVPRPIFDNPNSRESCVPPSCVAVDAGAPALRPFVRSRSPDTIRSALPFSIWFRPCSATIDVRATRSFAVSKRQNSSSRRWRASLGCKTRCRDRRTRNLRF